MLRLIALIACLATTANADLYPDALLNEAAERRGPIIEAIVKQDIARTVPRSNRAMARRIEVAVPLRGRHPLDFYADPVRGVVYVPIESVQFFDDLAILQSWFVSKGCDQGPIQTYLWALLRMGRDLPPPLTAFGLERDRVLEDPFTDDVAGKVLKSGVYFILAHEVGHIVLGHQGGARGPFSQNQEREADAFALNSFAKIGTYPGGAALYFVAARWLDPTGQAAIEGSHPVAPERIGSIAARLAADPSAFSFSERNRQVAEEQVESVAQDLARVAELSSEEAMLTALPQGLQREFPLSQLADACPH